jgi:hypothetical protein
MITTASANERRRRAIVSQRRHRLMSSFDHSSHTRAARNERGGPSTFLHHEEGVDGLDADANMVRLASARSRSTSAKADARPCPRMPDNGICWSIATLTSAPPA